MEKNSNIARISEQAEFSDGEEPQVRHLREDEDLVIDGETLVDDLLVAQRIAQQDSFAEQVLREDTGNEQERRKAPSAQDVQKLLRLLRETSKLTSKIGELPSQFDALVSEELRDACRAASEAVTKLPLPESSATVEDAPVGEETWGEGTEDPASALAAVDLQSTDEETAAAEPSKDEGPKAQDGAAGLEGKPEMNNDEEEEAEVKEERNEDQDMEALEDTKQENENDAEEDVVKPHAIEDEEGAPVINVSHLPEVLDAKASKEPIGKVQSIVQDLIVVQGEEDGKALDLGSVLCQEDGRVLGAVVDVFGQISRPHYLVLPSESCKKELPKVGAAVLAATGMQETSFLCDNSDLAALQKQLGDGESDEESDLIDGDDSESEDSPTFNAEGAAALEAASRNWGGVWAPMEVKEPTENAAPKHNSTEDLQLQSPDYENNAGEAASSSSRSRFNCYGSTGLRQRASHRNQNVMKGHDRYDESSGGTFSREAKDTKGTKGTKGAKGKGRERERSLERLPPPPPPPGENSRPEARSAKGAKGTKPVKGKGPDREWSAQGALPAPPRPPPPAPPAPLAPPVPPAPPAPFPPTPPPPPRAAQSPQWSREGQVDGAWDDPSRYRAKRRRVDR